MLTLAMVGRPLARGVAVVVFILAVLAQPALARQPLAAIAVDARTGKVLFARNADRYSYPASLTKIMTLYVLFAELKAGRLRLDSPIVMSPYAASRPPSKLGLKAGASITVENAIRALVTKSANDVATAVAERLAGSEAAFAVRMTQTARRLAMTRTTFRNASGLPSAGHRTTARDMATLALRIQRDFPRLYRYFSLRSFTYRGRRYRNHNRLLGRFAGMDGLKTGYTRAAGYCLATSARRGRARVVAVVLGARSGRARNWYIARLMNRMFKTKRLARGQRLARMAGLPPGYTPPRQVSPTRRLANATTPAPRPRPAWITARKGSDSDVAALAQAAGLMPLAGGEPESASQPGAAANNAPTAGRTFMKVEPSDQPVNEITLADNPPALASTAGKADPLTQPPLPFPPAQDGAAADDVTAPTTPTTGVTTLVKNMPPTPDSDAAAAVDPAPSSHRRSWNIQIGAFPDREGARARLDAAKARARALLAGKPAFTMAITKKGATYYRARFSGFSRASARRACRRLTRRGVGCFALAPRG